MKTRKLTTEEKANFPAINHVDLAMQSDDGKWYYAETHFDDDGEPNPQLVNDGDGEHVPLAKFALGLIITTAGAEFAMRETGQKPAEFLRRHVSGDWGDMNAEDSASNDRSVESGSSIYSAYTLSDGTKIWIITALDRSNTTILLPSEY